MHRVQILGVPVDAMRMEELVHEARQLVEQGGKGYVCVCPNMVIMEARQKPALLDAMRSATWVTPDGVSVVWASRLLGYSTEHIRGADLVLRFSLELGYSHFFYGGAPGTAELLAQRLRERNPQFKLAGTYTPPFRDLTPEEDTAAVEILNRCGADIIWVGLGGGRQEIWMAEHRPLLQAPLLFGVGAAFDFLSGRKREAPYLIRRCGLEWLFRLLHEPRRLWRRNLYHIPFLLQVLKQKRQQRGLTPCPLSRHGEGMSERSEDRGEVSPRGQS